MGEESFELRVKRLFGSKLFESVPDNSFPTASWSVAGGEVERREWNRDRGDDDREDEPASSAFYDNDGCLAKRGSKKKSAADRKREFDGNLVNSDDEEEEEEEAARVVDEEQDIRDSVGLDPTLDNEDEEDEYDKAAVGRESADDRLYMKDVKDHGPYLHFHSIIPDSAEEPSDEAQPFHKDPRADHFAANVRLNEDNTVTENHSPVPPSDTVESTGASSVGITGSDINLKPILKRRGAGDDSKPKKRVRFNPECIDHEEAYEELHDSHMVPQSVEPNEVSEIKSTPSGESHGVPDYLRNPSKYTHYTFDSTDNDNEETNKRAFEDFLNLVKHGKPGQSLSEFPMELPKSVTFTPRKKSVDVVPMDDSPANDKVNGQSSTSSMGIAAIVDEDDGTCEMDEDDAEAPMVQIHTRSRRGRQYRSKSNPDESG